MSYIWFSDVLDALGKRINFESISNLYGNSFCKDSDKMVRSANPLKKTSGASSAGILDLVGKTKIIEASNDKKAAKKAVESSLGDVSWAEGLF